MSEEVNSVILSLLEKEIPEGRQALRDGHENLAKVAAYCEQKYIETNDRYKSSADRGKALEETRAVLEETKQFATQSLASVAYQINSLALNMLGLLDQQALKLQDMESTVHHISETVDMHKEKVARRGIGTLASSKPTGRGLKITAAPEQEKPASYSSKAIDFSALDHLDGNLVVPDKSLLNRKLSTNSNLHGPSFVTQGHGVPTSGHPERQHHPSMSHELKPHQIEADSKGSLRQKMPGGGALKRRPLSNPPPPPVAPPMPPSVPYSEQGLPPPPSIPFSPAGPFLPPDDDVMVPPPPPLLGDPSVSLAMGIPSPPPPPSVGGAVPAPPPPPDMPSPPPPPSNGRAIPAPPPPPGMPSPPPPPSIGRAVPAPPPSPGMPSHLPPPSIRGAVPAPPPPSGIPSPPPPPSIGGAVPAPPAPTGIPSPPPVPSIGQPMSDLPPPPLSMIDGAARLTVPDTRDPSALMPEEELPLTPNNYIEKVVSIYEYVRQRDDELTFQEGVVIYVIKKNDDGWYEGVTEGGASGLFPGNYVEVYL